MRLVNKFQAGGVAPAPAPVSEPAPVGDPMEQLIMAAQEAVATQNPELAMEVCMMLLELVGAAPSQAPVGAPAEGQPIFRKGGKMKRKGARKC